MIRTQALEAQIYALYGHLQRRGLLDNAEIKAIAINAQEAVAHLSNADEVVEEIRCITGVRPL